MPLPTFWLSPCDPCPSYVKMKEPERKKLTPCPVSPPPRSCSTNKGKHDLNGVRSQCTSGNRFVTFWIGAGLPVHPPLVKRKEKQPWPSVSLFSHCSVSLHHPCISTRRKFGAMKMTVVLLVLPIRGFNRDMLHRFSLRLPLLHDVTYEATNSYCVIVGT